MKMLDTNICSYLIRGIQPWAGSLSELDDTYVISSVVAYELEAWAVHPDNSPAMRNLIQGFIEAMRIIPFDAKAASASARVAADLRAKRKNIGAIDPLVAGHAMSQNAILITNDAKDFVQVPGLKFATSL